MESKLDYELWNRFLSVLEEMAPDKNFKDRDRGDDLYAKPDQDFRRSYAYEKY